MATSLETYNCYEAVTRDDPQFDGKFFTAVLTTGIFCRPTCRAQTPRPENVRFVATAAAAAESGFRPCLRCKPESAPDPPPSQATSPIVARALRLIGQGFLDEAGVGELALRLNVSSRQLGRLFLEEFGAPPVAVAQTRRLLFAKKLIDETNLSMADVAFSAGYGSVRRFNDAIRQTYARTPTQLRKSRRRAIVDPSGTTVGLKLFYRDPYNWSAMLGYLRAHAIPGVERVDADGYRRTIRVDGACGVLEVRPLPDERAVLVRVPSSLSRYLLPITERVKDIFDLRADPNLIDASLASDPYLTPLIHKRRGMRIPGAWDGYELAIRAILDSLARGDGAYLASALVSRFGEEWPEACIADRSYLFPTPERLSVADLTGIGLTMPQAEAIQSVSRAVANGTLDLQGIACSETLVRQLSAEHGIREPDARTVAMRTLGEPDVLPVGTTWVREAVWSRGGTALTEEDIRCRSEQWRPWRSYAAMYLWASASQSRNHGPS